MPEKRRPQNRLKPISGPLSPSFGKPAAEFTGTGEEWITGEGGGILRFKDGECIGAMMARMGRVWTPEDTARRLRIHGRLGLPISPPEVFPERFPNELARFSAKLIEAAHGGDAEAFRRIAEAFRRIAEAGKKPHPDDVLLPGSDMSAVLDAVTTAATLAKGIPTREQVRDILNEIKRPDGGKRFTTVQESDKLKILLAKIGFQWLPGKKQGEHLRRKSP